jgi:hypothetical protein
MYPNLKAEIARKGFTLERLVEELKRRGFNITVSMLSQKLNGKYDIYLNEAKALKQIVETDISIDILFEEAI